MSRRRAFGALPAMACVLALLLRPHATGAADVLDPYRALLRSPAGAGLLAEARRAMTAHFEGAGASVAKSDAAPADSEADWPATPVSVYISLVDGSSTRACVGTEAPLGTLRETVRALAVQALQSDRRRPPVRGDELEHVRVVLAFADAGAPIADPMTIAPARDGLLIRTPRGSVAFLPGEARTVAYMLREARRIGLVHDVREASFARLQVVTVSEPRPPRAGPAPRTAEDAP